MFSIRLNVNASTARDVLHFNGMHTARKQRKLHAQQLMPHRTLKITYIKHKLNKSKPKTIRHCHLHYTTSIFISHLTKAEKLDM